MMPYSEKRGRRTHTGGRRVRNHRDELTAVIEANGDDVFARKPVGSGPYKFVEHVTGSHIKLEAMPSHWRLGTPKYKKWQEQVMKFRNGVPPPYGAIWLTLYPNIMVEWYPHVLVVSTLVPRIPLCGKSSSASI